MGMEQYRPESGGMVHGEQTVLAKGNLAEAEYGIQEAIRGLFGKKQVNAHSIGGHPDFDDLAETRKTKRGFNVSLFMDIKGSTRLGVVYKPEEVFFIKNSIIQCAIETIRAFDGHVHRIMGDAVLAFFRSDGNSARNAAIDAVNCGCYLVEFMRQHVAPKLQQNNIADVGIRVGVDYGKHDDVVWGMYGFQGSSEVTATSFFVDVAAKLQQCAPRNRVMLGESIRTLLDLHDDLLEPKWVNNRSVTEPYILPNYTDSEGKPVNYKKHVLVQAKYFDLLPKPEWADAPIRISALLKPKNGVVYANPEAYQACSRAVRKGHGIDFKAKFRLVSQSENVKVRFKVTNHGLEAGEDKTHYEDIPATFNRDRGEYWASYWRDTAYTGLHYMTVSVLVDDRIVLKEQDFGVYIGAAL
jgi:class 3 adenylate cyclase